MKKKLLWVLGIVVLITGISIYFYLNNREYKNIQKDNLVQLSQEGNEEFEREYLLAEECYDESGELSENPDYDNNRNIINCYNEDGNKEGKWIFYNSGQVMKEGNYKDGKLNGKSISYDENGEKLLEERYLDGEQDGENIFYWEGEWWQKFIFENGELIDMQENDEVVEKMYGYYKEKDLRIEGLWNKFTSGDSLNMKEFKDLTDSVHSNYNAYYDEELMDDENDSFKDFLEDMYKGYYEDKSWRLVALYAMMNCSEDISNPYTYLFNLDDPQVAQDTYFKNCPKGCRYVDEEDVDFICE